MQVCGEILWLEVLFKKECVANDPRWGSGVNF